MNPFVAPNKLAKLTIEITTKCNIKCAGCPRTTAIEHNSWTDLHMPLPDFERIINHIPETNFVTLHGIGEPTLHPHFLDIVRISKDSRKFSRIKMTTNALSRKVDYYAKSIEAGLDEFWISVDTFDQVIANTVRKGTNTKKLERQVAACISAGLPVHISLVVSSANHLDIPTTLMKLHAMGCRYVHMQEFQDFGNPFGLMSQRNRLEFLEEMKAILPAMSGMKVFLPTFTMPQGEICTAPWFRPAISVEGYFTPCCTTFDPDQFSRTSLVDLTFEEAWASPGVQSWINRFLRDQTPICNGCGLNPRSFGVETVLGRSGKTGKEIHVIQA